MCNQICYPHPLLLREGFARQYDELKMRYTLHATIFDIDLEYENAQNLYSDCLSTIVYIESFKRDYLSFFVTLIQIIATELQKTYNL
jgi:hypothetical protein